MRVGFLDGPRTRAQQAIRWAREIPPSRRAELLGVAGTNAAATGLSIATATVGEIIAPTDPGLSVIMEMFGGGAFGRLVTWRLDRSRKRSHEARARLQAAKEVGFMGQTVSYKATHPVRNARAFLRAWSRLSPDDKRTLLLHHGLTAAMVLSGVASALVSTHAGNPVLHDLCVQWTGATLGSLESQRSLTSEAKKDVTEALALAKRQVIAERDYQWANARLKNLQERVKDAEAQIQQASERGDRAKALEMSRLLEIRQAAARAAAQAVEGRKAALDVALAQHVDQMNRLAEIYHATGSGLRQVPPEAGAEAPPSDPPTDPPEVIHYR